MSIIYIYTIIIYIYIYVSSKEAKHSSSWNDEVFNLQADCHCRILQIYPNILYNVPTTGKHPDPSHDIFQYLPNRTAIIYHISNPPAISIACGSDALSSRQHLDLLLFPEAWSELKVLLLLVLLAVLLGEWISSQITKIAFPSIRVVCSGITWVFHSFSGRFLSKTVVKNKHL